MTNVSFKTWSKYSPQCWDFWSSLCSAPQEHELLSYSSTRTKAPSVIVSGLKPATWYVFSVRTRTAAGYSSYSPKYEYETTGDCKYLRQSTVLICCTAVRPKNRVFFHDNNNLSFSLRKSGLILKNIFSTLNNVLFLLIFKTVSRRFKMLVATSSSGSSVVHVASSST